ncbi:DUF5047 domain-containing protein [Streptomyces sp. NPDC093595]|uniref:DUF5047 domain-containing protein n=1 Tax=Streptomyces sp. NPDC093595 TaxID=3366045 RepID=UPI0037FFB214
MYTVTDRFLQTLAESHTPVAEVALYLTTGAVEQLEITGGSVSVDRKNACRRTCTVTLADPALIPRSLGDQLSVYGSQLRIAAGVEVGAYRETVPVGVFRVDSVEGDVDEGPVTISGKSLECVIADDKFTTPYRASGTAVAAITALIQRSLPSASVINRATDAAIGARTWDIEGDPWAAITEIGAAIGAEVYCDANGSFVIAELPDLLTTTPAWTVAAGDHGVYISASRGMTSDNVYNGVHARGENSEANTTPVSALVVDSDPASPTYWSGPYGRRPYFYSSSTLTTVGACTSAATLLLRQQTAPNATASLRSLANPALEPGDVLRVVYPDGTAELHQVASFSIDLGGGGDFSIATISAKEGS